MPIDLLQSLLPSVGTLCLVVIALVAVHRVVLKAHTASTGKKFRNQLIMLGLSVAGGLLVFLFLPISEGLRGQILSLLGIVISAGIALSSTTILGNAMAGFMIRAVRAFRLGDFIEVQDHFGRVSDMGLFHTEVQTEDRDLKALPNLLLVTHAVKRIRPSGTIISAHVSLGYDIAPGRIQQLLLKAAETSGLKDPFVRIVDLADHAVTYKVAGFLGDVSKLLATRSDLRGAILDTLHGDGVEIVSPQFRNTRILDHQRFIPPADEQAAVAPKSSPNAVVFDKAEEAASLDSLRTTLEDLEKQKEALNKRMKEETDSDRAKTEEEVALLQQRSERLVKVVAAREARAEKKE